MKQVINKEDKAVSPIIATILLIAITVVLAATLVTILGGFTHGAGNTVESAGISPALSGNGTTITATVDSSSQTLNNTQISFVLTINSTHTFSGVLSDNSLNVSLTSSSWYIVYITSSSTLFTGGTTYTFSVIHYYLNKTSVKEHSGAAISSYSLTLSYKGSQFYNSGIKTS